MSYVVAAYAVVIGSLVAYGCWVQGQRRQLKDRRGDAERDA